MINEGIHDRLKEVYDEFDHHCRTNNIDYSIDADYYNVQAYRLLGHNDVAGVLQHMANYVKDKWIGLDYDGLPVNYDDLKSNNFNVATYNPLFKFTLQPLQESVNPVSGDDLQALEYFLDHLFEAAGIDFNFSHHFGARINDIRNKTQITTDEVSSIFDQLYRKYVKKLIKAGKNNPNWNAIVKDLTSHINIPFVVEYDREDDALRLTAKTIMRTKNFIPTPDTDKIYKVSTPRGEAMSGLKEDQLKGPTNAHGRKQSAFPSGFRKNKTRDTYENEGGNKNKKKKDKNEEKLESLDRSKSFSDRLMDSIHENVGISMVDPDILLTRNPAEREEEEEESLETALQAESVALKKYLSILESSNDEAKCAIVEGLIERCAKQISELNGLMEKNNGTT